MRGRRRTAAQGFGQLRSRKNVRRSSASGWGASQAVKLNDGQDQRRALRAPPQKGLNPGSTELFRREDDVMSGANRSLAWVHGLDWGTVPAWASAILTSGSLLLGFYILLRDRRKEERQEAAQVICWLERTATLPDGLRRYRTHVANQAGRHVSGVHLLVETRDPDAEGRRVVETYLIAPLIRPDEEEFIDGDAEVTVDPWQVRRFVVVFLDADGTEWIRDLTPDLFGPAALHPATISGRHRWPFRHSGAIRNMHVKLGTNGSTDDWFISTSRRRKTLRRAR